MRLCLCLRLRGQSGMIITEALYFVYVTGQFPSHVLFLISFVYAGDEATFKPLFGDDVGKGDWFRRLCTVY